MFCSASQQERCNLHAYNNQPDTPFSAPSQSLSSKSRRKFGLIKHFSRPSNSAPGLLRWFWSALCGHKKASISFRPHRVESRHRLRNFACPHYPRNRKFRSRCEKRLADRNSARKPMLAPDPLYGPAVCCKRKTSKKRRWVLHQCIRPICGALGVLLAIMDIFLDLP